MQTSEKIHPDQIGYEDVKAYQAVGPLVRSNSNVLSITIYGEEANFTFQRVHPQVLRISCSLQGESSSITPTHALLKLDSLPGIELKEQNGALVLHAGEFTAVMDKASLSMQIEHTSNGSCGHYSFASAGPRLRCRGKMEQEAAIFGLGETTGYLNKRGERYTMWNSDVFDPHVPDTESLYQSIPVIIHHTKRGSFGLFIDNPGKMMIDLRESEEYYDVETINAEIDLYVIAGSDLAQIVTSYTALTGRMQMPPLWSLGYQQSRFSYMNQEEVLELARTFRDKNIPCDVIYLDIHYMDSYKVFTFDEEQFPDPKGMIQELKQMGIRIVPIVDPGVKNQQDYNVYEEGVSLGHFCQAPEGGLFTGNVWPGPSVFPDFTEKRTREWWGALHRFYVEYGISGIWNDMNEPSIFNSANKTMDENVMHGNDGNPKTHGELHNIYGMLMCKATREGLDDLLAGERSLVLTRAGYAGIQRYAAVWTGDNRSYWQHMELFMTMGMNLGLSGVAFCGSDVGGFAHHASGELLIRWTQLGAFSPFFRNHSAIDTRRQEPWAFDEQVEAICRKFIELRYSLLPYMYTLFRQAAETGVPIMRPLVLEYPNDRHTYNLSDQFLLGSDLLVAPICKPGVESRAVYLPEGVWYDFWSGERYEGGRYHVAQAGLDSMPLFVKAGAVVPMTSTMQHTMTAVWTDLDIHIYAGAKEGHVEQPIAGQFSLYEDDGITDAYKDGDFNEWHISYEQSEEEMEIRCRYEAAEKSSIGNERNAIFTIHQLSFVPTQMGHLPEMYSLKHLEEQQNGWYYDKQGNHLFVKLQFVNGEEATISICR